MLRPGLVPGLASVGLLAAVAVARAESVTASGHGSVRAVAEGLGAGALAVAGYWALAFAIARAASRWLAPPARDYLHDPSEVAALLVPVGVVAVLVLDRLG